MGRIIGIGLDLVEVARIADLRRRHGERFEKRVFSEAELAAAGVKDARDERVAARFAAKEAVMKALGTGWAQGVGFKQIEVFSLPSGQPVATLKGAAALRAQSLGANSIHITMTDQGQWAAAVAILEGPDVPA
jgi:holo-[acyl-carrier protein] synthase